MLFQIFTRIYYQPKLLITGNRWVCR
uniref:Uncharacterized protein n=1 Tax=Arundo donax TaxID=35708 RepID=A0A0A9I0V5_ARUDO